MQRQQTIKSRGSQPRRPSVVSDDRALQPEAGPTALHVTRSRSPRPKPSVEGLVFGSAFSDHMLLADYDEARGWREPRIVPYGALSLDPATAALHYGQTVFDGFKAYRGVDGRIRLFRPRDHLSRLSASAARLVMPGIDPDRNLEWLIELVRLDAGWVPSAPGTSLYLRPVIIASEAFLGVRPSRTYLFYVIATPAGPYFGNAPLRLRVEDRYVRAVEGGIGVAKTGGNYAASLLAAREAQAEGYDQVLWLGGRRRRYLDEAGTMNVMLLIGDEVVTPPLGGAILAGVVRDSALTLMRDWGLRVSERPISIDEVMDAARGGRLGEAWGTGTAAGISAIGELAYRGEVMVVNGGEAGPLTLRLRDALAAIQYGSAVDLHGWTVLI